MTVNETEKKLEFFDKMLSKNPELQNQFKQSLSESANSEGNPCNTDSGKYVSETAHNFIKELETLNFSEPDWEMYTPRHSGYIPEYEAMMYLAEDMIAEICELFKHHIFGLLSQAEFDLGFLSLPVKSRI